MYRVELDGRSIGETQLEMADPPMGVVWGKVIFTIPESPFSFFKTYCESHQVPVNQAEQEFGFIDTQNIAMLKVYRSDGIEIVGLPGASILGFEAEGYYITILAVPYPFYQEEFPHHCEAYEKRFRNEPG